MLKYLFKAEFADGSFIQQNQDDVSSVDPTKSMFFDVLNHPSELIKFSLGDFLSLHLLSGEFVLNGNTFSVHDPSKPVPSDRRLIFFRRHTHTLVMGGDNGHEVEYHLGWQATVNGENVQHTVAVS